MQGLNTVTAYYFSWAYQAVLPRCWDSRKVPSGCSAGAAWPGPQGPSPGACPHVCFGILAAWPLGSRKRISRGESRSYRFLMAQTHRLYYVTSAAFCWSQRVTGRLDFSMRGDCYPGVCPGRRVHWEPSWKTSFPTAVTILAGFSSPLGYIPLFFVCT